MILTLSQKNLLRAALVAATIFIALGLFFFLSMGKRIKDLKKEEAQIRSQVETVESLIRGKTINEGFLNLQERLRQLNSKFPDRDEMSLKMISEIARACDIVIKSTQSQPQVIYEDENNNEIKINGKTCQSVTVTLEVSGDYFQLVQFLSELKRSLPADLTFEKIGITKSSENPKILNARMIFNIFLLS